MMGTLNSRQLGPFSRSARTADAGRSARNDAGRWRIRQQVFLRGYSSGRVGFAPAASSAAGCCYRLRRTAPCRLRQRTALQPALTARTTPWILARPLQQTFHPTLAPRCRSGFLSQEATAPCQLGCHVDARQQTVMANTHESLRQDVQQKPAQKFLSRKAQLLDLVL